MKGIAIRKRKEIEKKLANVFEDEVRLLSAEYRQIFFNDLASTFENRLSVLSRAQSNGLSVPK
jgi:hypothetical protein